MLGLVATRHRVARGDLAGRRRPAPLPPHGRALATGRLEPFLIELQHDEELDDQTKGTVTELAQEQAFLFAVADYLRQTIRLH